MIVHLDTSTIVAHLRGSRRVAERIETALPNVSMRAIVLGELLYGARASNRPDENRTKLREFAGLVQLIPFDGQCAESYSVIRFNLRRAGTPRGDTDTLIAATALAHGATLITHNTRHFEGIDGLIVEDWV